MATREQEQEKETVVSLQQISKAEIHVWIDLSIVGTFLNSCSQWTSYKAKKAPKQSRQWQQIDPSKENQGPTTEIKLADPNWLRLANWQNSGYV